MPPRTLAHGVGNETPTPWARGAAPGRRLEVGTVAHYFARDIPPRGYPMLIGLS